MRKIKIILILLAVCAQLNFAQQTDIKKDPGYFDFSEFSSLRSGEVINEVYLEEALLKMVAGLAGDDKNNVGDIVSGLKLVKVQEFMINEKDLEKAGKTIESMDKDLLAKNWVRIIKSRNKDNFSNVYVKPVPGDGYGGLVITTLSGEGKAAVVNIVGKVDLESIGKLSKQFNLPSTEKK